ncbi:MAG TPA: terminase family protein [Steroidobacteraceae bacterium]
MVFMPRGAAKSTNSSVVFPSWYLGKNSGSRLMEVSYGADLAKRMGRRTRSIIRQPRYKSIFQTALTTESSAADRFLLDNGSEYMATGIASGGVGSRADGIVFDDPVSGREAAESELQRDKVWENYFDDLLPCLTPKGWVVLVMTRWHEDDIAGRILPSDWNGDSGYFEGRDGMRWRVLCLQARCETTTDPLGRQIGEYLDYLPRERWALFESNPRTWDSMCQQRPRPIEGAFFSSSDMLVDGKPIETPLLVDAVFAVIDSAMKDGKPHDGIACMFFALTRYNLPANPPLVVLDWDLQQIKGAFLNEWIPSVFVRLEQFAKDCKAMRGSIGVFVEDKSSGTVLLQQTQNQPSWLAEHPTWVTHAIDSKLTMQGKKGKAANASGHVKAGQVKWTRRAYERVQQFKGVTKNHAWGQVLKFSVDSKDGDPDDCLDTFSYGVALALGNEAGF